MLETEKRISSICTQFPEIKYLASCALLSYVRSLVLLIKTTHKNDFSSRISAMLEELNSSKLSQSWGLPDIPIPVKQFISTLKARLGTKSQKGSPNDEIASEGDDQLLVPKGPASSKKDPLPMDTGKASATPATFVPPKQRSRRKKTFINELGHSSKAPNTRILFDHEGNATNPYKFILENSIDTSASKVGEYFEKRSRELHLMDDRDRALEKEKRREKKKKLKAIKNRNDNADGDDGSGNDARPSHSTGVVLQTAETDDLEALALVALRHP